MAMDSVAAALEVNVLKGLSASLMINFYLAVPVEVGLGLCVEIPVTFELLEVPSVMMYSGKFWESAVCIQGVHPESEGMEEGFGLSQLKCNMSPKNSTNN